MVYYMGKMEQPRVVLHPPYRQLLYFDAKSVNERLLQLATRTGYNCIQRNGQRYYGPPPDWVGPPPPRGSEIFIGRLPRDCFEDEIVPVFESIAPLYEVRMMMNYTGFNRGFAFVTYCNPVDAWNAVKQLNNYEIRSGRKLGVSKSTDNCRLYIGGISTSRTKPEIWEEMSKLIPMVRDVILYVNPDDRTQNRGFFFAEFETHRAAALAKRTMVPGLFKLWNNTVVVDWADPEPDVDPNIMANVTKLFVRNLSKGTTASYLRSLVQKSVADYSICRIYVSDYYAFIHFDTRANAQKAKEYLSNMTIDGEKLDVHWARPRCYKKHIQGFSGQTPCLCRSIPPRLRQNIPCNVNNTYAKIPLPYIPVYPGKLNLPRLI